MKIGAFSSTYHVSVDQIRYYIKLGLLVPGKKNTQYDFLPADGSDLEEILYLKQLRFSLKDIHHILSIKRMSNLISPSDLEDLIHLYEMQKARVIQDKMSLESVIHKLETKVSNLSSLQGHQAPRKTGVPLMSLPYLCCPGCQIPLNLNNVDMNHQYIFSGDLSCTCGYTATIKDGVVLTKNKNTSPFDQPDLEREFYLDIPPALVSLFKKSYNWMLGELNITRLTHKIVLETHINAYFFLYNHIKELDSNALYIVVDKFPEIIDMYKRRIEQLNPSLNILYIADSSLDLPIKKGIIDLFIDYFSTNENSFYSQDFLMPQLSPYFHNDTLAIGTYFYFEPASKSIGNLCMNYPDASSNNFNLQCFRHSLNHANFYIREQCNIGMITNSGDNRAFSFHENGEPMHMYSYCATPSIESNYEKNTP